MESNSEGNSHQVMYLYYQIRTARVIPPGKDKCDDMMHEATFVSINLSN